MRAYGCVDSSRPYPIEAVEIGGSDMIKFFRESIRVNNHY